MQYPRSTNPNHTLKNLEDAVASLLSEIRELSTNQNISNQRTERLEATLDLILEGHPSAPNLWLTPKQLGKLIGLSSSSVSKYRHDGLFGKLSVKEAKRGKRVDYYYHRQNALKDLQKRKPVHIRSNSLYISDEA